MTPTDPAALPVAFVTDDGPAPFGLGSPPPRAGSHAGRTGRPGLSPGLRRNIGGGGVVGHFLPRRRGPMPRPPRPVSHTMKPRNGTSSCARRFVPRLGHQSRNHAHPGKLEESPASRPGRSRTPRTGSRMQHGPPGPRSQVSRAEPPACRPLLMPLRLSPRALRKHLLSGFSALLDGPTRDQQSIRICR